MARSHGPKVVQPATPEDAALVAAATRHYGSRSAAARVCAIPQPRLATAREAGKGRALSAAQRERLSAAVAGVSPQNPSTP